MIGARRPSVIASVQYDGSSFGVGLAGVYDLELIGPDERELWVTVRGED